MAATPLPTPWVAEPEAEVGRTDDAEIEGAETHDIGIVAEQADPQAGLEGDDQTDRTAHGCDRAEIGASLLRGAPLTAVATDNVNRAGLD